MNKTIEEIYMMAFDNYISPSRYLTLSKKWNFERFPFGGGTSNIAKGRITNLINQGKDVKCGYMCNKIRELPDHFIIYK